MKAMERVKKNTATFGQLHLWRMIESNIFDW